MVTICDSLAFYLVFGLWGKFGDTLVLLCLHYRTSLPHIEINWNVGGIRAQFLETFLNPLHVSSIFFLNCCLLICFAKDHLLWSKVSAWFSSRFAHTVHFIPRPPSNSKEIAFNYSHLFCFRLCLSCILVECFYSVFLIVVSLGYSLLTFSLS